jgi:hypothetical protein
MDEAAHEILNVTPTTIAGVRAFLSYAAEAEGANESGFAWPGGGWKTKRS